MNPITVKDEIEGKQCGQCKAKASRSNGIVLFDGGPISDGLLCARCIQPHLPEHPTWTPTRSGIRESRIGE